jgi:hypothetical protein
MPAACEADRLVECCARPPSTTYRDPPHPGAGARGTFGGCAIDSASLVGGRTLRVVVLQLIQQEVQRASFLAHVVVPSPLRLCNAEAWGSEIVEGACRERFASGAPVARP